jgi:hypothetical protein
MRRPCSEPLTGAPDPGPELVEVGTTRRAAAVGVGARTSAARSQSELVLLVAHGGHHRDEARRDGADDALVIERERSSKLPPPRAEDHDVDAVGGRKPCERASNGCRCRRPARESRR